MPNIIGSTDSLYDNATIAGQIVQFSGTKRFHKIAIDITVNAIEPRKFIVGQGQDISFQAGNFHNSRSEWIFQPVVHWNQSPPWMTTGTTIKNTFQTRDYSGSDIAEEAPFLEYYVYFPEAGTYDLWSFGSSTTPVYWSFDNDEDNLFSAALGNDTPSPYWTQIGNVFVADAGVFSFKVYLGLNGNTVLDQWLFTKNYQYLELVLSAEPFTLPITNSKSSFNTAVRLRGLSNGHYDLTQSGVVSVGSWGHSGEILSDGRLNYLLYNSSGELGVDFTDGLSIEFWQIGGDKNCFCSWNYSFVEDSVGNAFKSLNWGQSI